MPPWDSFYCRAATVYPFERWRYRHIGRIGDGVEFEFVDKTFDNSFILTTSRLPYALRIDFIRFSEDMVLVPITMELANQDLHWTLSLR